MSKVKTTQRSFVYKFVDEHTLKMRVQALDAVLNQDNNRKYARNAPYVSAMLGIDKLKPDQMTMENVVKHLHEGVYNGHKDIGFNQLITSHSQIANTLFDKSGTPRLAIPCGVGIIGHCSTCAAGGRANLAARYVAFRSEGEASEDPEFDAVFDQTPFADFGGTTLLIPIFTWNMVKINGEEVRRPRFNLCCSKCFERSISARDKYMKEIEMMARRIPSRNKEGKYDKGDIDPTPVGKAMTSVKNLNSKQEATRITAVKLLNIIDAYPQVAPQLQQFINKGHKIVNHVKKGKRHTQRIETLSLNGASEMITVGVDSILQPHGLGSWQEAHANAVKLKLAGSEEE